MHTFGFTGQLYIVLKKVCKKYYVPNKNFYDHFITDPEAHFNVNANILAKYEVKQEN